MSLQDIKNAVWDESTDLEVFGPLTAADVERAEAVLGVKLPAAYLDLLEVQNGGYVSDRFDALPTKEPTSWADDHVWVRTIAGIGPDDHHASVTYARFLQAEWRLPEGLVPLSGDGHFSIALDYRAGGPQAEPSIAWFDTEVDQDLMIAPDFRSFVEALVPLESFDDDVDLTDPPIVHVRREATGAAYCGYELEGVSWIAEDLYDEEPPNACVDCIALIGEFRQARG